MSGRGRGRRGGGGMRRGGPPGRRNNFRRGPPQRNFQEIKTLDSIEITCEQKVIEIDFNSNEQGQFMRISEASAKSRRIIVNMDSAKALKDSLDKISAHDFSSAQTKDEDQERRSKIHYTDGFKYGNRQYTVEVRSNDRGFFMKLSVKTRNNPYIAIPLESLPQFSSGFKSLFEQHYNPQENESPPPASPTNLPSSREVRAGGKSFYFDVDKNDRGTFVRLTEVVRNYGRRTHINIPNSCWPQMSEVFSQLAQELPFEEGNFSLSGSEDN